MGETEPPLNQFFNPFEVVGTDGAQKCRGSGAPNLNQHPNDPLCHAMCTAAIFFEVVAKALTVAINFLRLFKAGSARMDLVVGASEVGCGAGEDRIYTWSVEGATGSGHLVA